MYAGDTLIIHVSTGVEKVKIPNVLDKQEDEANSTLTNMGLKVEIKYKEDESKDNGIVLTQSINADKEVEKGTSITLYVNKKQEEKTCQIHVNLVKLLNYQEEKKEDATNNTTTTEKPKAKSVTVNVYANGSESVTCSRTVELTASSKDVSIGEVSGKGTVNVKIEVIVDGSTASVQSKNINLENNKTYLFE